MSDVPLLTDLVRQAKELYSLPAVALEVLDLTRDAGVDAARLKACIQRDPALTSRILRVVNSSLFGLSGRVSNLNQALALLGIKPLKLLVLGFSLPDTLTADLAGDLLARYWRRTLSRAVAARNLAERVWRTDGDDAFLAGLLADVGHLVLIQAWREPYAALVRRTWAEGGDLLAVERRGLGFDHRELSSRLLHEWGLPESLVQVLAASEPPSGMVGTVHERRQILRVAELLARALTEGRLDQFAVALDLVRSCGHASAEVVQQLADELHSQVAQLADVLALDLDAVRPEAALLDDARRRLAEVAEDAALDLVRAAQESEAAGVERVIVSDELRILSEEVARLRAAPGRFSPATMGGTNSGSKGGSQVTKSGAQNGAVSPRISPAGRGVAVVDHDPGLLARLAGGVEHCRQAHAALTLLFFEVDRFAEQVFARGLPAMQQILARLELACLHADQPRADCYPESDGRLAIVLAGCDRRDALDFGHDLLNQLKRWTATHATPLSASGGLATVTLPARNFPPAILIESAQRCLFAAQAAGGNCLKSIEI